MLSSAFVTELSSFALTVAVQDCWAASGHAGLANGAISADVARLARYDVSWWLWKMASGHRVGYSEFDAEPPFLPAIRSLVNGNDNVDWDSRHKGMLRAVAMSCEFVMNPVGFLCGLPISGPRRASKPYWH